MKRSLSLGLSVIALVAVSCKKAAPPSRTVDAASSAPAPDLSAPPTPAALAPVVKQCWPDAGSGAPPDAGDETPEERCAPVAQLRALYEHLTPAERPALFTTLLAWLADPTDWRLRKVAAAVLPTTSDGDGASLGQVLAALRRDPPPQTPPRIANALRADIAEYAAKLAARVSGQDAEIVALVRDKTVDLDARAAFIAALGVSPRPGYFETLTALAKDAGEADAVRREAIDAFANYAEPERQPAIGTALLDIAKNDPRPAVCERALFAYKGYGLPDETNKLLTTLAAHAERAIIQSGIITLRETLGPKASPADKKLIVTYLTRVASFVKGDGHTRLMATTALRGFDEPHWKALATQLAASTDPDVAVEAKELLAQ
jgi:hypothetical protein